MKRLHKAASLPAGFALTAFLAWQSGGPPADEAHSQSHRAAVTSEHSTVGKIDAAAILRKLERNLLTDAKPPPETYNGDEMERRIAIIGSGFVGAEAPMTDYGYAWAREAPKEMFAWLKDRGPFSSGFGMDWSGSFISAVFESWAEKDMEAALAATVSVTNREWRQRALASVAECMWKNDPARTQELIVENLKWFRPELGFPFSYSKENWEMLVSLPPGKERTGMLAQLLRRSADWKGPELLSIWEKTPEPLRREIVAAGFFERYATDIESRELPDDSKAVFPGVEEILRELAETTGDSTAATNLIKHHGQAWAARDFQGALEWAQKFLPTEEGAALTAGLFTAAIRHDFDGALQTWQSLPNGILKARAAEAMVEGAPSDRQEEVKALITR